MIPVGGQDVCIVGLSEIMQDVFPVIYSTLAPQAILSRVLPHYDLNAVDCQFWNRGLSDIYLVKTRSHQYVLRVSQAHWRSKADIDFELELLNFLQQRQLPVAYPLKTTDGRLSVEINAPEGKRYAALFIHAPGEIALGDLNEAQSRKLGETVAKLHATALDWVSQSRRQPLSLEYLLDHSVEAIAPFLQHKSTDYNHLLKVKAQLKDQLKDLTTDTPLWGICWGDPHSGNVHFTSQGDLTLFDFDQCGYGWRVFDIAKFWQVSLQSGISRAVREAFLDGYQSFQKITKRELNSLQALTQVAHIWVWAISLNHAKYHSYSRLDDTFFHKRLEHLKRLSSPDWQLF